MVKICYPALCQNFAGSGERISESLPVKFMLTFLGQTFGSLIEQTLRKVLLDSPSTRDSSKHWVQDLPRLSASAAADLERAVNAPDFRTVESQMWK